MLIAVHELEKGLRVCEFADLDLVGPLAKFTPHRIQHEFGQGPLSIVLHHVGRIQRNPLSSLVGGDVSGALFVGGA